MRAQPSQKEMWVSARSSAHVLLEFGCGTPACGQVLNRRHTPPRRHSRREGRSRQRAGSAASRAARAHLSVRLPPDLLRRLAGMLHSSSGALGTSAAQAGKQRAPACWALVVLLPEWIACTSLPAGRPGRLASCPARLPLLCLVFNARRTCTHPVPTATATPQRGPAPASPAHRAHSKRPLHAAPSVVPGTGHAVRKSVPPAAASTGGIVVGVACLEGGGGGRGQL